MTPALLSLRREMEQVFAHTTVGLHLHEFRDRLPHESQSGRVAVEGLISESEILTRNLTATADALAGAMNESTSKTLLDLQTEVDWQPFVSSTASAIESNIRMLSYSVSAYPSEDLVHRTRSALRKENEAAIQCLRCVALLVPSALDGLTPDVRRLVWTFRIRPWAYLRSMWSLFWSAIRHPLSETTIDLSTGRVLYRT